MNSDLFFVICCKYLLPRYYLSAFTEQKQNGQKMFKLSNTNSDSIIAVIIAKVKKYWTRVAEYKCKPHLNKIKKKRISFN